MKNDQHLVSLSVTDSGFTWSWGEFRSPAFESIDEALDFIKKHLDNLNVKPLNNQTIKERLPELARITGGKFIMGKTFGVRGKYDSEYPPHLVSVPDFYLGKTPVTVAEWNFVCSLPKVGVSLGVKKSLDSEPVTGVNYYQIIEYCHRLSVYTGKKYRLPSEAEWEYACRAGSEVTLATPLISKDQACFDTDLVCTVGYYPPNAWGLYDMLGTVWEVCQDNWHPDYEGAPTDGSARRGPSHLFVIRGGSFASSVEVCNPITRFEHSGRHFLNDVGFRVATSVD